MKKLWFACFVLLCVLIPTVIAQQSLDSIPLPGSAEDNACNAGGSMDGKCNDDMDGDGVVTQEEIDWAWNCGWYLTRWEQAGGYNGTYVLPVWCSSLLPPRTKYIPSNGSSAPATVATSYAPSTSSPTPIMTQTLSITFTPSNTPTITPTFAPTDTPTITPTFTPTDTPTNTPTFTPTDTPTNTPTFTPTDMPTNTPTFTPTDTPTDMP